MLDAVTACGGVVGDENAPDAPPVSGADVTRHVPPVEVADETGPDGPGRPVAEPPAAAARPVLAAREAKVRMPARLISSSG